MVPLGNVLSQEGYQLHPAERVTEMLAIPVV